MLVTQQNQIHFDLTKIHYIQQFHFVDHLLPNYSFVN